MAKKVKIKKKSFGFLLKMWTVNLCWVEYFNELCLVDYDKKNRCYSMITEKLNTIVIVGMLILLRFEFFAFWERVMIPCENIQAKKRENWLHLKNMIILKEEEEQVNCYCNYVCTADM